MKPSLHSAATPPSIRAAGAPFIRRMAAPFVLCAALCALAPEARAQSAALERDFALGHWDATGGETDILRICTSWATTPEQTAALIEAIEAL